MSGDLKPYLGVKTQTDYLGREYQAFTFLCPCADGGVVAIDTALGWKVAIEEFRLHVNGDDH